MTIATDPVDRAEVDSAGGNSAALPLAQSINGWNGGDYLEHDKLNAVLGNAALWKEWLDQTRADTSQLGFSASFRTAGTSFGYGVGPGLADRVVQNDSYYVVLGRYVPLTLARLNRYQTNIWKHTFSPSVTTHFYVDAGGVITPVEVVLGTPPAPAPGFETLLSVDTNATDITAEVIGAVFLETRTIMSQVIEFTNQVRMLGPVLIDGGNLVIDKAEAQNRRIDLTVDNDTTRGWRVVHNTAERLQFQELITGVATTILDLGTAGPTVQAAWSRPMSITSAETTGGPEALTVLSTDDNGPGSSMTTARTPTLTLNATGPGGVPVVLVPRTPAIVGGAPVGSILIGNDSASDIRYKDNNGNSRIIWATQGGSSLGSIYTLANLNNFAGATVAQTFNYDFVSGRRYLVKMACRVGRAAGSSRDALFTCTVGGVALAYSGQTILLWQGGGVGELEQRFDDEIVFTAAATATLAVQLLVTPVNGAGNLNVGARSCRVLGHFD